MREQWLASRVRYFELLLPPRDPNLYPSAFFVTESVFRLPRGLGDLGHRWTAVHDNGGGDDDGDRANAHSHSRSPFMATINTDTC